MIEGLGLAGTLLLVVFVLVALAVLARRAEPVPPTIAQPAPSTVEPDPEFERMKWERDWYLFFYKCYSSWERFRAYGLINAQTELLGKSLREFLPIEQVAGKILAPRASDGLVGSDFLYFGSRVQVLRGRGVTSLYSMSYHGSHSFAHSDKSFDALIPLDFPMDGGVQVFDRSAGLIGELLQTKGHECLLRGKSKYYVPLSHNAADLDGDGEDDFVLGGRLYLSGPAGSEPRYRLYSGPNSPDEDRETTFLDVGGVQYLASLAQDGQVVLREWNGAGLQVAATIALQRPASQDRPFTILAVGADTLFAPTEGGFVLVGDSHIDIYRIAADLAAVCVASANISGFGEIHIGARGKFLGGEANDLWLAEPRWKDANGEVVGRMALFSGARIGALATATSRDNELEDVASVMIYGSRRYTDYDGIGSTLSPRAGYILGNRACPDVTFSGHRHMNEFGAMFICPGELIREGARLCVDHEEIVKIVGRAVSQLAPPFVHLDVEDMDQDGYDELVVAADNDVCAGLNSGAIYVLSGKKIKEAWVLKRAENCERENKE